MLYRPDRGWGFKNTDDRLDDLLHRVQELETRSKRAKLPTSAERSEGQANRADLPATAEQFETGSKSGAG